MRLITTVLLSTALLTIISCKKGDDTPEQRVSLFTNVYAPDVIDVSATSVTLVGDMSGNNDIKAMTEKGFSWGVDSVPNTSDKKVIVPVDQNWMAQLTGLKENTVYHVRTYATNSAGVAYSTVTVFKTLSLLPTVKTKDVFSVSYNFAILDGEVLAQGDAPVTTYGICWGTKPDPTIQNDTTIDGSGIGSFFGQPEGLKVNVKYYARAYATNKNGTAYGETLSFTTFYSIGDVFGGGKIFYVDNTKIHGLIAAPGDFDKYYTWLNMPYVQWTYAWSDTDGKKNTNQIISAQGSGNYAAIACTHYNGGGYTDWFLPSIDQLDELYKVKDKIGGFEAGYYWSSTETNDNMYQAYSIKMGAYSHEITYQDKSEKNYVRAVRAF